MNDMVVVVVVVVVVMAATTEAEEKYTEIEIIGFFLISILELIGIETFEAGRFLQEIVLC